MLMYQRKVNKYFAKGRGGRPFDTHPNYLQTIEELQNELNEVKSENETLQDKVVKLVDMVKVERKKVQDLEQNETKDTKLVKDSGAEGGEDLRKSAEQVRRLQKDISQLEKELEESQNQTAKLNDQLDKYVYNF